ncbi:MAG TPA: DUF1080 domain-containing protein [Opitutaceae bacterium]|nr:DUF1080 domain-containing protein [Opitutaceae bacterium]
MPHRPALLVLGFLTAAFLSSVNGAATPVAPSPDKAPWKNLFDGKTLDGWAVKGGKAQYEVVNGVIIGTTILNNNLNSFLCTAKDYGNFILELDFLVDSKMNSGVQIRSECFDKDKTITYQGKEIKIRGGKVHGYQVEIDPSSRAWTGGIYDEGRRLWLVKLDDNKPAQTAFKAGEWNHFRIEAIGTHIRTWLNGVFAADLTDGMTPRGFIGLQVHQIGKDKSKEGSQVRFRSIRIQDLDTASR